jgi:hypothetical protein
LFFCRSYHKIFQVKVQNKRHQQCRFFILLKTKKISLLKDIWFLLGKENFLLKQSVLSQRNLQQNKPYLLTLQMNFQLNFGSFSFFSNSVVNIALYTSILLASIIGIINPLETVAWAAIFVKYLLLLKES